MNHFGRLILGVGLCLVLGFLLIYGIYIANAETKETLIGEVEKADFKGPFKSSYGAVASFVNIYGERIGEARFREGPNGVLVILDLAGLPAGQHAIHIHERADCTPIELTGGPDAVDYFANAGSHYAPDGNAHGILHEGGPHAGDLQNIYVAEDGTVKTDIINDRITLEDANRDGRATLFDEDGSALVIHEGHDDYFSQPTGNTGDRIACAIIQES